jgi:hypothetical protein
VRLCPAAIVPGEAALVGAIMNNRDSIINELLELLSFAIVNLDGPEHAGHVRLILDRLERMGQGEDPLALPVLLRVMVHRDIISFDAGEFTAAIAFCQRGMAYAGPDRPEYYGFAAGLGRACFKNGELQRGYAALGDAMQCALERGMDPRVVADLVHIGTFADPRLAPDTFVSALRRYAVTHAGLHETEFSTLWARTPDQALRRLLNEGTTTPNGRDVGT